MQIRMLAHELTCFLLLYIFGISHVQGAYAALLGSRVKMLGLLGLLLLL